MQEEKCKKIKKNLIWPFFLQNSIFHPSGGLCGVFFDSLLPRLLTKKLVLRYA